MDLPVYFGAQRVGALTVNAAARDTALTARCTVDRGLYRLYAVGETGERLLGVTEDGCLRRRFSPFMLSPAGKLLRGELRQGETEHVPAALPETAQVTQTVRGTEVSLPLRENEPFPLTALFCFARVENGRVFYLFDGQGQPVMPEI